MASQAMATQAAAATAQLLKSQPTISVSTAQQAGYAAAANAYTAAAARAYGLSAAAAAAPQAAVYPTIAATPAGPYPADPYLAAATSGIGPVAGYGVYRGSYNRFTPY